MKRSVLCLALILVSNAFGQKPASKPDSAHTSQLQARGWDLLSEVATSLGQLRAPENRIALEMQTADLLWSRDPTRARELFADATDEFTQLSPDLPTECCAVAELRRNLVSTIAQHDARMALTFLYSTRPAFGSNAYADNELEFSIASQLATQESALAFQLAQAALKTGVSYSFPSVYSALRQTDAGDAAMLLRSFLGKLQPESHTRDPNALNVAINLLNISQQPAGTKSSADWQAMSEVAARVAQVLNRMPPGENFGYLQSALPVLQKYVPTVAARLEEKMSAGESPEQKAWDLFRKASALPANEADGALLAIAQESPPQVQQSMYSQIAQRMAGQGNAQGARDVIDKYLDPMQRGQMLQQIDNQLAWQAMQSGDFEKAHALVVNGPADQRAAMLAQLAANANRHGNRELAMRFASEARNFVSGCPSDAARVQAQLTVARSVAQFDRDTSVELMSAIADCFNQLLPSFSAVDGFLMGGRSFRNAELLLQHGFIANTFLRPFAEATGELAPTDFDAALAAAHKMPEIEAQLLAELAIARSTIHSQNSLVVMFGGGIR